MKKILTLIIISFSSIGDIMAQAFTATAGQACRYECFGTCDNIYQNYFGQHNSQRAYVFDGSQGNYHDLRCSIYTESTQLGSCYVEQGGLYYSGYALNITQIIHCPLDSMAMLLFLVSSLFGYFQLKGKFNAIVNL